MLVRGQTGPEVRHFQLALITLGYTLPRYGADGQLGSESLAAFGRYLRDHGMSLGDDSEPTNVDDLSLATLYSVVAKSAQPTDGGVPPMIDRRSFASREHDEGRRLWQHVTGITLHQTACRMGERVERYNGIGAHFVVTRAGQRLWMHDLTRLIVHGNGWNARCVGIEIDGLYAGIEGNLSTVWDDKSTPNREQPDALTLATIESTKETIRWIVAEVAAHGGKLTKLVAHRQSSETRQSDPGEAIWKAIALPMMAELGLDDGGPGFRLTYPYKPEMDGRPIPFEWDPSRKGIRY